MNAFAQSFVPRVKFVSRTVKRVFPSSHYALLALFFLAGLELAFGLRRFVFFIIAIMLAITIAGIIMIRYEEQHGFHPLQAILPALAALSTTAFSLFLPTTLTLHLYFMAAAATMYYLLKFGAKLAYPTWNWIISLVITFLGLASIIGWRFHLFAPIYIVLLLIFSYMALMASQSLQRYTKSVAHSWILGMVMAFAITEVTWAMQFLPLHFMVQSGVILALYYIMFQLTASYYERTLSRRQITEYLGIGFLAIAILLISARWL